MLHINFKNGMTYIFHVGEQMDFYWAENVTEVQADCDELDVIRASFINLPQTKYDSSRSCRWFGEDAKFIVGNWPL